ncbi:MAG: hypothetical protein EHM48_00115 [Planctomycetaceae bacterium]|nr:MAG: hypothetical protein EHM48_00115 [Planctomycetaceae bacterium]
MEKEKGITTGIVLYPADKAIVERAIQRHMRRNFSDAVQFIIRDWAQLKAELEGAQSSPKRQTTKA